MGSEPYTKGPSLRLGESGLKLYRLGRGCQVRRLRNRRRQAVARGAAKGLFASVSGDGSHTKWSSGVGLQASLDAKLGGMR